MKPYSYAIAATAAFGAAAVIAATTSSRIDVSPDQYHCVTGQPGKYPVKILASDTGAIYHEGGVKRFEIDEKSRTCSYTEGPDDTLVFHMK